MLQETVGKALKISQEAAARMEEIQIQLSVLQRQCTFRDRPLCDTLRVKSFDESGIAEALKTVDFFISFLQMSKWILFTDNFSFHSLGRQLDADQKIFNMKYLGELDYGLSVTNLSVEVGLSESIFGNFPHQVKEDTFHQRSGEKPISIFYFQLFMY